MAQVTVLSEPSQVVFNQIGGFKTFNTPLTIEEAIQQSGCDFKVRKDHLLRVNEEDWDKMIEGDFSSISLDRNHLINSHFATVREDNGRNLGIVGKDYGVVQNSNAFKFIDFILNGSAGADKSNLPVITSCGSLNGGAQMFVSAKLPTDLRIGESDVNDYILFTNSHDGTYSVQVMFTPVRVVCQNTLNLALSTAKNKLVFKHTRLAEGRLDLENKDNLERAMSVLKMHEHFKGEFVEKLNSLATQSIEKDDVVKFVSALYLNPVQLEAVRKNNYILDGVEEVSSRARNQVYAVMNSVESGIGQDINRGSKLWLLNGLTTYISNEKKWKSGDDKFTSIIGGSANRKVQDAYQLLNVM